MRLRIDEVEENLFALLKHENLLVLYISRQTTVVRDAGETLTGSRDRAAPGPRQPASQCSHSASQALSVRASNQSRTRTRGYQERRHLWVLGTSQHIQADAATLRLTHGVNTGKPAKQAGARPHRSIPFTIQIHMSQHSQRTRARLRPRRESAVSPQWHTPRARVVAAPASSSPLRRGTQSRRARGAPRRLLTPSPTRRRRARRAAARRGSQSRPCGRPRCAARGRPGRRGAQRPAPRRARAAPA